MPAAAATGRPIAPRLWLSVPVTVARCGPSHTGAGQTGRVADVIAVSDPSDPRLTDFVRLTDVGLRTSLEAAHGLFVAEGEKVIRRAIGAGYQVRSLLVTPDRLATLPGLAADGPAPVYLVSPEVAERITGYRVHRGALASMARRPLPGVAAVVAGQDRILVLEDLVDHGNVGAIFRWPPRWPAPNCGAALANAVRAGPR
jgi:MRM3-like substrate binding domain